MSAHGHAVLRAELENARIAESPLRQLTASGAFQDCRTRFSSRMGKRWYYPCGHSRVESLTQSINRSLRQGSKIQQVSVVSEIEEAASG